LRAYRAPDAIAQAGLSEFPCLHIQVRDRPGCDIRNRGLRPYRSLRVERKRCLWWSGVRGDTC